MPTQRIADGISATVARLATGRAGSPLAGRVLHPLDDEQSFMGTAHPPIPFDPQGLVALFCLSIQRERPLHYKGNVILFPSDRSRQGREG
jgi:hypothetical protein